jgi:hypothetical protein
LYYSNDFNFTHFFIEKIKLKLKRFLQANRLAPRIGELVHPSQSAFIAGCTIKDSFKVVQTSARLLHAGKKASLLLKIDITRAGDSVP